MGNPTADSQTRLRAKQLGALDARQLIAAKLPLVHTHVTDAQYAQLQKVLDAVVINPVVRKQYDEIMKRSVKFRSGVVVVYDEKVIKQADRVAQGMIGVSERDRSVKLKFRNFVDPTALLPRSNNPDEAAYLKEVERGLDKNGVWLRIDQPWVRDPNNSSSHILDPKFFDAWLTYGYNGDPIPVVNNHVGREELLKTTGIGAGYYKAVSDGPVATKFKKDVALLSMEIDSVMDEYFRLVSRKSEAGIVGRISDTVGGADLPSKAVWEEAHKLLIKAMEARNDGDFIKADVYLLISALAVRDGAMSLEEYARKSGEGAASVVKVLKVVKTAGQVAEFALSARGVITFFAKGGAKMSASQLAQKGSVDDVAEKVLNDYLKKNPEVARDINKVRYVPGPRGSVGGNIKPGHSSGAGQGFDKGW